MIRPILAAVMMLVALSVVAAPIKPYNRAHAVSFQIETGIGQCTATAIGPHTLLTADHCIHNDGLRVIGFRGTTAEVESVTSDGRDHVLIRVKHRFRTWAFVRRSPLRVGEAVHYFGNPGEMSVILRIGHLLGHEDVLLPHPDTGAMWPQTDVLVLDTQTGGGDSGSGVFDERGLLVGVVSATYNDRIRVGLCLPLAFTREQWRDAAR